MRERRKGELAAKLHFLLGIAVEVMLAGVLDGRRVGREGLHDHLALQITATGAAGDLGDELERALAGAEVRDVQAEVGVEDADEGDIGEMKALGDHLGADEDVDLVRLEGSEGVTQRVFTAHRIRVDAGEFCFRENLCQDFLHFLRAVSLEENSGVTALGAFFRDDGLVAADMADEALVGPVVGERDGTVRALADMAAGGALQGAGESAAVEEQDGLLTLV